MLLAYSYLFMILFYVVYLGINLKKYSIKFVTDPVFWILLTTLYYLLIPNYSLFKLNPLNINEVIKTDTDIIILIFSLCILVFSVILLNLFKVNYNKTINFKIPKVTYQIAIIFYAISFLFFLYCYIVFFPQMLGVSTLEKKDIFKNILNIKFWIFDGLFLVSLTIIAMKGRFRFKVFFIIFSCLFLFFLPLFAGYRLLIMKDVLFLMIIMLSMLKKEELYLVKIVSIIFAIVFLFLVPIFRLENNVNEMNFLSVLLAPIGEGLFSRQSIDIAYEHLYEKEDSILLIYKTIMFIIPSFLRMEQQDNMDSILANYYWFGPELGLSSSLLNEGIYYGGNNGIFFVIILLLLFTITTRFFIFRVSNMMLFFIGVYAISNLPIIYRSGISYVTLSIFSALIFSFWVIGKKYSNEEIK